MLLYRDGVTYRSSDRGRLIQGTAVTVASHYVQNGYNYYVDTNGMVHHDGDLEGVIITETGELPVSVEEFHRIIDIRKGTW